MDTDTMTDDEALRVTSMTDGPKVVGKFDLKPLTAETLAWMQTLGAFDEDLGSIHKGAAFIIIHSLPKKQILPMVFRRTSFWEYVSQWLSENINHHTELAPYNEEFDAAWERYNAAVTMAAHPNDVQPGGIKN